MNREIAHMIITPQPGAYDALNSYKKLTSEKTYTFPSSRGTLNKVIN